jgi:hypothetical protein
MIELPTLTQRTTRRAPRPSVAAPEAGRAALAGKLGRSLLHAARWALLALLPGSVWLYGCTPPWTHEIFTAATFAVTLLWLCGLAGVRQWPKIPAAILFCVSALLALGWLSMANAQSSYDPQRLLFLAANPWVRSVWVPGGVDNETSFPIMLRIMGVLGILCVAADSFHRAPWRQRLLVTVLFTGVSWVVFGLLQRIGEVTFGLWSPADLEHNLFATYYYHGNAGAFANLLLPFAFLATVQAAKGGISRPRLTVALAGFVLLLAAIAAIASKAAQLVAIGLLAVLFVTERAGASPLKKAWLLPAILAAALLSAPFAGMDRARQRWSAFAHTLGAENPRVLADRATLRMLPDAGPFGIGPGNFAIAFPHYTAGLGKGIAGRWEFAHNDYLQTWVEWGWVGGGVWATLFALILVRFAPALLRPGDLLLRGGGFACLGMFVHAIVDFPFQIASLQLWFAVLLGASLGRRPAGDAAGVAGY